MKAMLFASLALLSAPALAGPTLWKNVEAGMTTEQLRVLYPDVKGTITHKPKLSILEGVQEVSRCHPDVHVEHPNGIVTKVVIYSRYRGFPKETCGEDAAKAMLAKYGQPTSVDQDVQETGGVITKGFLKGLDTTRNTRDVKQQWLRDGVLITFERTDPEVDDLWSITYETVKDIGL